MGRNILFRERYGVWSQEAVIVCNQESSDSNFIERHRSDSLLNSVYQGILNLFRQIFLPQGYPESVSADYYYYQIWDTVQAFCSTISGALTTQAIMKGVGVGNNVATPYGAAVMWILKDGTGMVGRIVFAWWKGTFLDADCKKWRLFADCLNDVAMLIELLLPCFPEHSTHILCSSTTMKAIVGVAGGATRAAITQHQAIRENMADVSAKDGSQETFVNLTASVIGILILSFCSQEEHIWAFFALFTVLHIYANYRAVKCLRLLSLNPGRLLLLIQNYLVKKLVISPEIANKQESVILGRGLTDRKLCGHRILLGISLKQLLTSKVITVKELHCLTEIYEDKKYMLIVDNQKKKIYVSLQEKISATGVIEAYFHAVLWGLCVKHTSEFNLKSHVPDQDLSKSCWLIELETALKNMKEDSGRNKSQYPIETAKTLEEIISRAFADFFHMLPNKGWCIRNHQLPVDEWRSDWSITQKEN